MREFARLYAELDETTATSCKLEALQAYFSRAVPENAAWAVYFLAGGKPRQAVPTKLLRQYAIEYAQLDDWLFEESYQAVGDLAETIAHILPPPEHHSDIGLAEWMQERIGPLRGADPATIREALFGFLNELDARERFLLRRHLVEMEDRSVHRRCGADLRAGRAWAPCFAVHRLHICGMGCG